MLEQTLPPLANEAVLSTEKYSNELVADLFIIVIITILHILLLMVVSYVGMSKEEPVLDLGAVQVRMMTPDVPKPQVKVPPLPLVKPITPPKKVVIAQIPTHPSVQPQMIAPPPPPAIAEPSPPPPVAVATEALVVPSAPKEVNINQVTYLNKPVVSYPSSARDRGIAGQVIVRVLIDENGLPGSQITVIKSRHKLLDDVAVIAVKRAKFKPYQVNGKAVKIYVNIPFDFTINPNEVF